jgi:glycosyltransferase involved in cell wall biosynthesis
MTTLTRQWDGPTITFVVPWYGEQVPGGAEMQARRIAEELCARAVPAEVFTTTAGGLTTDWTNPAFAVGSETVNNVPVRRFAVRPRNAATFDALNARLLRGETLSLPEEAVFVREIIGSDDLEAAVAAEQRERLYIFTPYMFGTSYWGMIAAARGYLIPCLHQEGYAHMLLYRQMIESAYGLLFYSRAEQRLAQQLCSFTHHRMRVLGGGVETDSIGDAARFRATYGIEEPFVLYAGRRDMTKNTHTLIEHFRRYHAAGGPLRLVCIGGPGIPLPADLLARGAAFDLGFVSAQDKYDACAAATLLCQPSLNESFSIVIMEAWLNETPALVHSDCAVTREFVEQSGGGLHFRTYDEFVGCLDWLREHPQTAQQMGQAGAAYVRQHFTWETIVARLLAFLRETGAHWWH